MYIIFVQVNNNKVSFIPDMGLRDCKQYNALNERDKDR